MFRFLMLQKGRKKCLVRVTSALHHKRGLFQLSRGAMRIKIISIGIIVSLAILPSQVSGQDREGCQDLKILTRLSGCSITDCSKSEYDAADLIVSTTADTRTTHVEGKIEKISYDCPNKSALQVRRNAENALKNAGFTVDFTGYDVPDHYVTAHKGPQWVGVVAHEMTGSSAYDVTAVLTGDMQQEMTSDADSWAAQIGKSGRVAVYGIEFATAQATLLPKSEEVLSQVKALLQKQPDWKMKIEGHTDSTGTKAGNQALSEKRAAAVVGWLVDHGIASSRLTSAGLGDTKPITDNATNEGRAHNRRVELVKE